VSALLLTDDELRDLTGLTRPAAVVRRMKALGAPAYLNAAGRVVVPRLWFENWCKPTAEPGNEEEYDVRSEHLPGGKGEPPAYPQRR
jgi:hypothetical protein